MSNNITAFGTHKDGIHPNGHKFEKPYHANPNKKAAKRIEARIADYETTCQHMERQFAGSSKGMNKPGSAK